MTMAKEVALDEDRRGGNVSGDDLRRAIGEITRQKDLASEYAGLAGKATQNAVERFGLNKDALTRVRRNDEMEPTKRQAFLASFLDYSEKLGHLDGSMFPDDLIERLAAIVRRHHNRIAGDEPTVARSDEDRTIDDALLN